MIIPLTPQRFKHTFYIGRAGKGAASGAPTIEGETEAYGSFHSVGPADCGDTNGD